MKKLAILLILAANPAFAVQAADGSFNKTFSVSGTVDLEVSTGSGSVDIKQGNGNIVEVHGMIYASRNRFLSSDDTQNAIRRIESNPPFEQSGSTIRIGRNLDRDLEQHVSISYEIIVPAQSNIRAHSGSGGLKIDGITGRVDAGTGSGGLSLSNINGDLQANTGSGTIRITGVRGGLRAQTGSGGIDVAGEQTSQWELQTGSGGIDIHLPRSASFALSAHTGSGGVSVDFPLTVSGQIDGNGRNVVGTVGSGSFPLNARTGSGRIRITSAS
jgi:DUF4097 and DUF4098 domain-containing protein YvlB